MHDQAIRERLLAWAEELPSLALDASAAADLDMIGNGALSPVTGFMGSADFNAVIRDMRLSNGLPWTIPIVLGADRKAVSGLSEGQAIALRQPDGYVLGLLELAEIFSHDAETHARAVFGTDDIRHPGVEHVRALGDVLVAGPVTVIQESTRKKYDPYEFTPRQLRAEFAKRGWKTVVAFQTRNPIHRAHEYLMKCAAESTDGLLLHPLIGQTKGDDLSADVRLKSYQTLLQNYFNPQRTLMAVFPAAMRYAGPREAVFHAIVRKNYGCTHFIVGRDHAGANRPDGTPYYGSMEAQEIFARFTRQEIGIQIFFYDNAFYCRRCDAIVTEKTAPDAPESRFMLSGTRVRELLRSGVRPPPEITRPEVADILMQALRDEEMERKAAKGRDI
jgi:sulfate adenylyltransferase